jgi:hypothetical protein
MQIPVIQGVIDRRILVNFRVDATVLARLLPSPFRPQRVNGLGMAGVCLIRLKGIRPRFVPSFLGIGSENAAHRIAVEWDQDGKTREGVFIPRRDTSSRLNTLAGGRLFPGSHHHASFQVQERKDRYRTSPVKRHSSIPPEGGRCRHRCRWRCASRRRSRSLHTSCSGPGFRAA